MKRFSSIVIHIGTEKTGSSAIQHFLRDNERSIRKDGFYYPRSAGPSFGSQWKFVAAVTKDASKFDMGRSLNISNETERRAFVESFRRSLFSEFHRARSARRLIISSEHFHSRLHTKAEILDLREFLAPWTDHFQIIVFFRRQDRVAVSFYSTRAKSGAKNQGPCFPNERNPPPRYYRYDTIFELWSKVFGTENVASRVYEDAEADSGVIDEFCRICQIPVDGKVLPKRVNKSLTREGIQFLRALNRNPKLTEKINEDDDRVEINRELTELFPGKYYPVSRDEAIAFYKQFEASNARLKDLAFPNRNAPLFDEDFSNYPEIADTAAPSYEEAVAIGIELWQRARSRKQLETFGRAMRRKFRIK